MIRRVALTFLSVLAMPAAAQANPLSEQDSLYKAIASADTAVFAASNRCDLETFEKYFTDDLEFYHDKGGLSVGKSDLLQKTKDNFCGKMVRELVPGTMMVYPLPGFGALEIDTHRFLHPGEPANIGQAQFLHVWQLKDGHWRISRVVSYDH